MQAATPMADPRTDELCARDPALANFAPHPLPADVTVAMSAYGNHETTRGALRSLMNSAAGDFELLLVDDCSPDDGRVLAVFRQLQRERRNTRVFRFDRNLEYSGSLNCILSHARGERVLFLSNDIFVTPAYLRGLFTVAASDARLGVVRGCSNFVDNGLPSHNVRLPQSPRSNAELFAIGEQIALAWGREHLPDAFLTGDAFLVTRAVLDRIGTFDPLFYGYFADHDFGLRARIAGFDLALASGAFAYHHQGSNFDYLPESERQAKLSRRWARVYENWARFKLKYGMPVELAYDAMTIIPWPTLAAGEFDRAKHYVAPADYSAFELK